MSTSSPTRPAGPRRAGLLDAEGRLELTIPGRTLRTLGTLRRLTIVTGSLALALITAGLLVGWTLRGLP